MATDVSIRTIENTKIAFLHKLYKDLAMIHSCLDGQLKSW